MVSGIWSHWDRRVNGWMDGLMDGWAASAIRKPLPLRSQAKFKHKMPRALGWAQQHRQTLRRMVIKLYVIWIQKWLMHCIDYILWKASNQPCCSAEWLRLQESQLAFQHPLSQLLWSFLWLQGMVRWKAECALCPIPGVLTVFPGCSVVLLAGSLPSADRKRGWLGGWCALVCQYRFFYLWIVIKESLYLCSHGGCWSSEERAPPSKLSWPASCYAGALCCILCA